MKILMPAIFTPSLWMYGTAIAVCVVGIVLVLIWAIRRSRHAKRVTGHWVVRKGANANKQ